MTTPKKGEFVRSESDGIWCGDEWINLSLGPIFIAHFLNAAFRARLREELEAFRERAAQKAELGWVSGKNSIARAEELGSGLCDKIAAAIRSLPVEEGLVKP